MAKIYAMAFGHDHCQILGNGDGQHCFGESKAFRQTNHYKWLTGRLPKWGPRPKRVAYWWIMDDNNKLIETIRND